MWGEALTKTCLLPLMPVSNLITIVALLEITKQLNFNACFPFMGSTALYCCSLMWLLFFIVDDKHLVAS